MFCKDFFKDIWLLKFKQILSYIHGQPMVIIKSANIVLILF